MDTLYLYPLLINNLKQNQMEKQEDLFQNLSPEERIEALKNICTKTELQDVRRPFDKDVKEQLKDFVTDESTVIMDKKEEFAKIAKEFNDAIKAAQKGLIVALKDLKRGYSLSNENVFLIADQESGMMNTYDSNGIHIGSRRLFMDERQSKIIDMNQNTGTHG